MFFRLHSIESAKIKQPGYIIADILIMCFSNKPSHPFKLAFMYNFKTSHNYTFCVCFVKSKINFYSHGCAHGAFTVKYQTAYRFCIAVTSVIAIFFFFLSFFILVKYYSTILLSLFHELQSTKRLILKYTI